MLNGIRILGQAKNALIKQHEIIANNLANLGTVGFKKDAVAFHRILDEKSNEVLVSVVKTDAGTGDFKQTSNPLDFSIQGEGYFSIQTPQGTRYTRDGSFQINDKGILIDQNGNPVLSEKGNIVISPELKGKVSVGLDGRVSIGTTDLGKLLISNFKEGAQLIKTGENLFDVPNAEFTPGAFQVIQGSLEMSNSNSVQEMVEMMDALRLFETSQTTARMGDEALGKAISQLA
ncbi:MAG: flagellar hook-basal body protein [Elusimicrobiota bacterium]